MSKSYRLGTIGSATLADDVSRWWAKVRGKPDPLLKVGEQPRAWRASDEFWALKDVSFDVSEGQVLGIIGRNGAGKSTLLKILSQLTAPSAGRVRMKGRLATLLEVGTGFHPELSGRENIFLNGAILGMTKTEIRRKLDEIIAFAEIDEFVDTPVKRYSSGMYVRLAFAVAAHLEPDILLVDEVLAVGDVAFQKKCLGKMSEAARGGRTILFVSHNIAAIENLCPTALLLERGRLTAQGSNREVLAQYLASLAKTSQTDLSDRTDREGDGRLRFCDIQLLDDFGRPVPGYFSGQRCRLRLTVENKTGIEQRNVQIAVGIDEDMGQRIMMVSSDIAHEWPLTLPTGLSHVDLCFDELPLVPGPYHFTLCSRVSGTISDWVQNAGAFDVEPSDFFGTGRLVPSSQGHFLVRSRFQVSTLTVEANV